MEPQIQYAKTKDGVSIAFSTLGEGPPFVLTPLGASSHIQLEWQIPEIRALYEGLAARGTLVRYDTRGMGLSERNIPGYSLDALLLDLEAVTDRLDLPTFSLVGTAQGGMLAVAYATRHPERVSHLILAASAAHGSAYWQSPRAQAFAALRQTDWDLYVEAMAGLGLGAGGASLPAWSALVRDCASRATMSSFMAAVQKFDVRGLLHRVKCPTLVLEWPGRH